MNQTEQLDVIGLLPAGGRATRLAPLPLSKELFPVGFHLTGEDNSLKPKAVCHYLLEKMRRAGITKAFFILRPGKWDIPAYLGDGAMLNMHLGYLTGHVPPIGNVIQAGIDSGMNVEAIPFAEGSYLDVGTPEDLLRAIRDLTPAADRGMNLG